MTHRIGIFGGSFDPPHQGHAEALLRMYDEYDLDKILVCPAYEHTTKQYKHSFFVRAALTKLMIQDINAILSNHDYFDEITQVCTYQYKYIVDLILAIKCMNPQSDLILFVGDDVYPEIESWKHVNKIHQVVSSIVSLPRGNVSSTKIRELIQQNQTDQLYPTFLTQRVYQKILLGKFYQKETPAYTHKNWEGI